MPKKFVFTVIVAGAWNSQKGAFGPIAEANLDQVVKQILTITGCPSTLVMVELKPATDAVALKLSERINFIKVIRTHLLTLEPKDIDFDDFRKYLGQNPTDSVILVLDDCSRAKKFFSFFEVKFFGLAITPPPITAGMGLMLKDSKIISLPLKGDDTKKQ